MKTKEEIQAQKKAYNAAYSVANAEAIKAQKAVYYAANAEKIRVRKKAYNATHKEERKAYNAAYSVAHVKELKAKRASHRGARRARLYGLSPEAFQLMLLMQKNACGLCEETFSKEPHVDHCHETGEVRGLLCGPCNRALGQFGDSLEGLERAKEYLRG